MKISILVLSIGLLACSKQIPTFDDHLQNRFLIFKTTAEKAALALEVDPPEISLKDSMFLTSNIQVATYEIRNPYGEFIGFGLHITKSFLVNPPMVLEHVATHEICHIHLDKYKQVNTETAAEKCVWDYAGGERFMEVYEYLYETLGYSKPTLEDVKKELGVK